MKKIFLILTTVLLGTVVFAQSNPELMQSRRELQKQSMMRMPKHYDFPQAEASSPKDEQGSKDMRAEQMPLQRWFPGEWDEVQAIFVTCTYNHYPAGHDNDDYYYADPIMTNYAEYQHYTSRGWAAAGYGPYVSHLDTSNDAFINVFFYLMDGIQQAGVQAWVRVEQLSDSSLIKRKLARMGLKNDNMRFIEAPGNSFWYRDCGPICFYYGDQDSVAMLDFMYYPGRALDDSLPSAIEAQMGIPNYITDIEWEGGNCLVDGAGLVMSSNAIYENNRDNVGQLIWRNGTPTYSTKPILSNQKVQDSLGVLMAPRGCKILPKFRYDGGTGHIDLYADMWTETEFVFSKFPGHYANWTDAKTAVKNIDTMTSWQTYFEDAYYTKRYIPFPCTDAGGTFSSQTTYNNQYTRSYSNHTFVNKFIIQPCFSNVVNGEPSSAWDKERIDSLRTAYPGYTIYPINIKTFDGYGGAIHCITKQIPAENPIRFIHKAILGNTGDVFCYRNAEIQSVIRNRSGIANAKVHWRANGGDWHEEMMTITDTGDEDDLFSTLIPTCGLRDPQCDTCFTTIEYYIEATSNNGKTMLKPITADQGGYFTFYLGNNPETVAIDRVEHDGMGQFYPNPATSEANIRMELGSGARYNVTIVDAMGRTVHSSMLEAAGSILYTIDSNRLSTGTYTVIFETAGQRITRRLVVQ